MIIFVILFCHFASVFAIVDPSHFSEELFSMVPKGVTILHHDLGRTVNGYNIIAYGLTAIPGIPSQYQISDLSAYPSSVILSYMQGNSDNSVNLLFGYVVNMAKHYSQDYYLEYTLSTGIVWLIPYINIDAIEMHGKSQNSYPISSLKNRNKNSNSQQKINCQQSFPGTFSGVNINYNFLQQFGEQFKKVCSNIYAGTQPFSETESRAIRNFFEILKIKLVIDLQSGEDQWVYPSKINWNSHKFTYLYEDIIKKMQKNQVKVAEESFISNPSSINNGGFINWAVKKDRLVFKYLITNEEKGPRLQNSASSAFNIMNMLIKKNCPVYNKYRSNDLTKLYIESISLVAFTIKCQVSTEPQEYVQNQYLVEVGQVIQISLESPNKALEEKAKQNYEPKVSIAIVQFNMGQVLEVSGIPVVTEQIKSRIQAKKGYQEGQISNIEIGIIVGILLSVGLFVLLANKLIEKKKGKKTERNSLIQSQFEGEKLWK